MAVLIMGKRKADKVTKVKYGERGQEEESKELIVSISFTLSEL